MAAGSSTTTYRMKLFCKRPEWLQITKALFNDVVSFYYYLLLEHKEFWDLGSQQALRELEILTLTNRQGEKPQVPLPFSKVPVYFRRAAINNSIAMIHNYHSNYQTCMKKREALKNEKKKEQIVEPGIAKQFECSPLFYKGMYKDFENSSITLKLYTGSSWCWIKCSYKGRTLPIDAEKMSPTVVLKKTGSFLHIPVKTIVEDIRVVKKRLKDNENICGITFTNTDAFAVCVIYSSDGRMIASRFIRGGKQYVHHSKRALDQITCNRKAMGKVFEWKGTNLKYWEYLKNLSNYWAHQVSREILNFCEEHKAKILTFTKIKSDNVSAVLANQGVKKHIRKKIGTYSPFMLSSQIKQKLEYKAWKQGIVITGINPNYTADKCALCNSFLIKQSSKQHVYRCRMGHTGNKDLNTAKNITMSSLKKFSFYVA